MIPRVWPTGIPTLGKIASALLTQLDIYVTRALDGLEGGEYDPSQPLSIGGAGLKMRGTGNRLDSDAELALGATSTVNAYGHFDFKIGSTLYFRSGSQIYGTVEIGTDSVASTLAIHANSFLFLKSGAQFTVDGYVQGGAGASWGGPFKYTSAHITLDAGSDLKLEGTTKRILLDTRSLKRAVTSQGMPVDRTKWTFDELDLAWQCSALPSANIAWPLRVPDGVTIKGIGVTVAPAGSHGGMPQYLPSISLLRQTLNSTRSSVVVCAVGDSSGSLGAYEARHDIANSSACSEVVNKASYLYWLVFSNEDGTNALSALKAFTPFVYFDQSSMPED